MGQYKKIAFLFPGQGAQFPGMIKDFYDTFSIVRETFEEADDILGRKLSDIILNGPDETLTTTMNSQPAIYTVGTALLRLLKSQHKNITPFACAGLSLGEYTALTAAGILDFTNGLQLVQQRGKFMNEACLQTTGTMAVILGLTAEQVETMVADLHLPNDLWAANFNCPGQTVISGTQKGIDAGAKRALEIGAKRVLPLNVHGAFHSGLMISAEEQLAPYIAAEKLHDSAVQVVMNVTAAAAASENEIKSNLIKQVTKSVRWEQSIEKLASLDVDVFIEFAPGKTLSGFNKRICPSIPTLSIEKIGNLENMNG